MKVIVRYLKRKGEHSVKPIKGRDFLLEAAKRELRAMDPKKPMTLSVIMECYRKGRRSKAKFFSTYFVLLAAGMTKEARRFRKNVKTLFDIDIAK